MAPIAELCSREGIVKEHVSFSGDVEISCRRAEGPTCRVNTDEAYDALSSLDREMEDSLVIKSDEHGSIYVDRYPYDGVIELPRAQAIRIVHTKPTTT